LLSSLVSSLHNKQHDHISLLNPLLHWITLALFCSSSWGAQWMVQAATVLRISTPTQKTHAFLHHAFLPRASCERACTLYYTHTSEHSRKHVCASAYTRAHTHTL
jgi:hypothetical protein